MVPLSIELNGKTIPGVALLDDDIDMTNTRMRLYKLVTNREPVLKHGKNDTTHNKKRQADKTCERSVI